MEDIREPVLVWREHVSHKILFVDKNMCRKKYIYFGPYVPSVKCKSPFSFHRCEMMTQYEIDHLDEYDKSRSQKFIEKFY